MLHRVATSHSHYLVFQEYQRRIITVCGSWESEARVCGPFCSIVGAIWLQEYIEEYIVYDRTTVL
jgi:hypothetical protein